MTTKFRPRRSALYIPASSEKALAKIDSLACDSIIIDLEDAVAPEAKEKAREMAVAAAQAHFGGRREIVIRTNGLDTPWGREDMIAAVAARPNAILVPKVSMADDIHAYSELIGAAPIDLWAMIETSHALFNLHAIAGAGASTRLTCFVMGTNDLAKETLARLVPGRMPMLAALSLSVAAARSGQLSILDGVYNDIGDAAGLIAECEQGRNFGFDGKTLIHPSQIAPCNNAFAPSDDEIAFAKAVVAAFSLPENTNKGAIKVEGKMAERLHLAQAERLLAVAEAIAAG